MSLETLEATVTSIDLRLERVEQKLPTLATKDELQEAVAKLATKDELRRESEETRRQARILYESLHADIGMLAEHLVTSMQASDAKFGQVHRALNDHDLRILRLESEHTPT